MLDITTSNIPIETWTEDRVAMLRRLWADGLSASQIAGELGGISRNAAIGKLHRLGLTGQDRAPRTSGPRKPRASTAVFRPRPRPAVSGNTALAADPRLTFDAALEPEVEADIIPIGQRCTLLELSDDTCRWPIGDPGEPDFYFCGGRPAHGLPYCGYHTRVAYQPRSSAPKKPAPYYYARNGSKPREV